MPPIITDLNIGSIMSTLKIKILDNKQAKYTEHIKARSFGEKS